MPDPDVRLGQRPHGPSDLFWEAMKPVCERYPEPWDADAPWEELLVGQLALYTLWLAEETLLQEGFHGFLWNQAGFHLTRAPAAARLVGAEEYAEVFEAALSVFPNQTAPVPSAERRELLSLAGDSGEQHLAALDNEFSALLSRPGSRIRDYSVRYIESHAGDFFQNA